MLGTAPWRNPNHDWTLNLLTAQSLRYEFNSAESVLHSVDFTLGSSEVVSLMGTSGAGKSTLLACLAGIIKPTSGIVTYEGVAISSLSAAERASLRLRHFGFVFQFGELVPELTVAENVALPLLFTGRKAAFARRESLEALTELGVGHLSKRHIWELSGGESQRVAVARALVHKPAIIFADEPTGSLDSANSQTVLQAMLAAANSRHASVLLITHDVEVASRAQRQLTLVNGELVSS